MARFQPNFGCYDTAFGWAAANFCIRIDFSGAVTHQERPEGHFDLAKNGFEIETSAFRTAFRLQNQANPSQPT